MVLGVVVAVLGGAAAAPWAYDAYLLHACERAVDERVWDRAAEACVEAHQKTGSPDAASAAAGALIVVGQADQAWRLVNLPEVAARPRAIRSRGNLLKMRGNPEEALATLQKALAAADQEGDFEEKARVSHALAGLHWEGGRYVAAYEALLVMQDFAGRAGVQQLEGLAELGLGDVFRRIGDQQRADGHYKRALELTKRWPMDQGYVQFKLGVVLMEQDRLSEARGHFEAVLEASLASKSVLLAEGARSRLVRVLAEEGEFQRAEALVDEMPPAERRDPAGLTVLAYLKSERGRLEDALHILEQGPVPAHRLDVRFDTFTDKGELLERMGRIEDAVTALKEAIGAVESQLAAAPEHQGWLAARRREPFDLLFEIAVHPAAGRPEGADHALAWEIVARYARAEALALENATGETRVRERLAAAEKLEAEWKALVAHDGDNPVVRPIDDAELLVLHEANDRLWVGWRRALVARFEEVDLPSLQEDLHRLLGDPSDLEASERVGSAIWRTAGLEAGSHPLYVATTGRLRRLALAALRHNGAHWMTLRPLARVPSLDSPVAAEADFEEPPLVLGDAGADLPFARQEARWVAKRLSTRAHVGEGATRDRLLSANGASILHVATHAEVGLEGGRLKLADGTVSAHDLLGANLRARLVVLASCASSVGREVAGSDSLATAFLRAGSGAVLATVRSVPDEASFELVQAFYEANGAKDPIPALAAAQARLAEKWPVPVWSAFVIYVGTGR